MARTTPAVDKVARDVIPDIKPKLRGWLHASAVPLSLVGGILLALGSSIPISPYVTTISFLIYLVASAVAALRGTSHTSFKVHPAHGEPHHEGDGHESVVHEDHVDHLHDGHKHFQHGEHVHEH